MAMDLASIGGHFLSFSYVDVRPGTERCLHSLWEMQENSMLGKADMIYIYKSSFLQKIKRNLQL
jgi:hypothetical protein